MSEKESLTAIDICSSRSIEDGVTTSTLNEASLKLAISMNNLGKVYAKMGKMDDSFHLAKRFIFVSLFWVMTIKMWWKAYLRQQMHTLRAEKNMLKPCLPTGKHF